MMRSSTFRKKILQVSSLIGFALLVGQTPICSAQAAKPAPITDAAPTTTVATPPPAPSVAPKTPNPVNEAPTTTVATPPPAPLFVPKTPNSVAVLDLGIRQEYREFFYDEKQSAKSSYKKPTSQTAVPAPPASMDESTSESSYSKQYGSKTRVTYRETKGLMTEVRTTLRNAGYTVIRPHRALAKQMEAGDLTTVKDRMTAGDFGKAQYVMIPNVVDASVRETREAIQGTSDYANKFEMNLTVEFTMMNTDTQAVVASFNASGSGSDAYLGKAGVKHVPDLARVKRDMLKSFNEDVKQKLLAQLPKPMTAKEAAIMGAQPDAASSSAFDEGDPKTLKVYRQPDAGNAADKKAAPEVKKDGVTIYRQ